MTHRSTLLFSLVILGATGATPSVSQAQRQMERLGRGTVVVRQSDTTAFVAWRLLATDPPDVRFHLDRLTPGLPTRRLTEELTSATHWVDASLDPGEASSYIVQPVATDGSPLTPGRPATVAASAGRPYHEIPVQPLPGYTPNDASVGDLDGDGEYELVVHMTGRGRDNSQAGMTDPPVLDAYRLDGSRLWSINLGRNIREGAHYTQFLVYDLDGDGRSELACKTADGSTDGVGHVIGDPNANHVDPTTGRVLVGPEFLTVFDGLTGAALASVPYQPGRGDLGGWGGVGGNGGNDRVGNRADRFLAGVAYLDGARPSLVMARGYYGRTVLAAWDWRDGKLSSRWVFDTNDGHPEFAGQGNHSLSVADVDGDGRDEIIYGSMVVDDDGRGLFSTGLRHGDALHVGDLDPDRPGLEVYGIHENESRTPNDRPGTAMYDARTGAILWTTAPGVDVGRGLAADIDPAHPGAECWGGPGGLRSSRGEPLGPAPRSTNFAVWWDGDPLRELLDGTRITKWNPTTHQAEVLLDAQGCAANNGSKATPALSADLWGRLARGGDLACRRQPVAPDLHLDDPDLDPAGHPDARPAVSPRGGLAKRRLQPAAAPGILPRARLRGAATGPDPGCSRSLSRLHSSSKGVGGHDFPAADGADRPPGWELDRVLDKPDAPIAEDRVDPAGMIAPRRDRRISRAAIVLIPGGHIAFQPQRSSGRPGVGRQGGGEAVVERVAVAPAGVPTPGESPRPGGQSTARARRRGGDAGEHRGLIGRGGWAGRSAAGNRTAIVVDRDVGFDLGAEECVA